MKLHQIETFQSLKHESIQIKTLDDAYEAIVELQNDEPSTFEFIQLILDVPIKEIQVSIIDDSASQKDYTSLESIHIQNDKYGSNQWVMSLRLMKPVSSKSIKFILNPSSEKAPLPSGDWLKVLLLSSRVLIAPYDTNQYRCRIEHLQKSKQDRAMQEDYEAAAKIKESLQIIENLLETTEQSQKDMLAASEEEDYLKASKLKALRDSSREKLLVLLKKADDVAAGKTEDVTILHEFSNHPSNRLEDISLSTIRKVDYQDEPSVLTALSEQPMRKDNNAYNQHEVELSKHSEHSEHSDDNESINTSSDVEESVISKTLTVDQTVDPDSPHPLEGVPGYEDLPIPAEIRKIIPTSEQGNNNLSNSFTSIASLESTSRMECILGSYCTRCYLSKEWVLREAALIKLSLKLEDVVQDLKNRKDSGLGWWQTFTRGVSVILERAVDDKIVQVFLTGLILLDDIVHQMEIIQAPPKEMTSLLSNVIITLVDKLGDSSHKVSQGCETALMNLALSTVVGPTYVGNQILKLISPSDSKAVKSVAKRCNFLKELIEEFGGDSLPFQKIIPFIQSYCVEAKDVEAREAGKQLAVAMFLQHGTDVLPILQGMPDRVTKEYQLAFLEAQQSKNPPVIASPPQINREMSLVQEKTPIVRRGRGRGRRRV
ncbi:hypothetical protein CTEN210_07275 [Chaetoceros tenuissimus]|uniref:TOG domain-containing protein n=1 Tax=Chaetoceros tenuissimus TaxID=426638 RepID=A0AAD3CS61_9STRA|nr:hypothetical protein CTEN210_00235 [Chaetoceros tenuissimus]GFH50799.1 hypothetical protein CTEN210_07275 [Chaetoceros tenuissimus]